MTELPRDFGSPPERHCIVIDYAVTSAVALFPSQQMEMRMRISTIHLAALAAIIVGAGCTTSRTPGTTNPTPAATGSPDVTVGATPFEAPARRARPSPRAADACEGVRSEQGGGPAYLDCLANAERLQAPH